MKEATGELNSTIVIALAVGLLLAFFYTVLWPGIRNNMDANTKCSKAYCSPCPKGQVCELVNCKYKTANGEEKDIKCVWKG